MSEERENPTEDQGFKTYFLDLKITIQTGGRPVFDAGLTIHTFDEKGVSGKMPVVKMTEKQNKLFEHLVKNIAALGVCLEKQANDPEEGGSSDGEALVNG